MLRRIMRAGRLVGLAAVVAILAACTPAGIASSPGPTFANAPALVANRAAVRFCGEEHLGLPDPAPNQAARQCFWDAYQTREPAEFVSVLTTIEGDPVTWIYRVAPGPRLEIFVDNTQDRFSGMTWLRLDCPGLALDPEQQPQPAFGPSGECQETELSR